MAPEGGGAIEGCRAREEDPRALGASFPPLSRPGASKVVFALTQFRTSLKHSLSP